MPDTLALTMKADVLPSKQGPSPSATSDMPVIDIKNAEPSEPAAEPEAPNPEESAPPETPSDESAAEASAEPKKPARGVQKRLDELTANWRTAQREAQELRQQLGEAVESIKQLTTPKPEADAPKPKPQRDSFDNPDAYDQALTQWSDENARRDERAKLAKEQKDNADREAAKQLRTSWADKRDKALEKFPDYVEVAESPNVKITPVMANLIVSADNGADLAYHLGKNPEVAERIASMNPVLAVFELGKIATSLAAKPEVTTVPPPVKPLGNRATSVSKTPDEMSMDEYANMRMPQLRAENSRFFGGRPKPN